MMFSKTNIEYWKEVGTKERKDGKKKEKKEGDSHTKKKKNPNMLLNIYGGMESGNYTLIKWY